MAKVIGSPLQSASNNIVNFTSSKSNILETKKSFSSFLRFMNTETKTLNTIKLPKKDKIQKLANMNISSTFGNVGNLLSNLASGALDVGGFLGNFFRGGGKNQKTPKGSPKPALRGSNLKLGGLRAIGITNAIFAGLDFATGIQEGESVGKSASGAGGALVGSLLGGLIGQTLIPVPGLGFVLGSMTGTFLGGWMGDRTYEAATGTGGDVTKKEKDKLKSKELEQRTRAAKVGKITLPEVLDKFSNVVTQFLRLSLSLSGQSGDENSTAFEFGEGDTDADKFNYDKEGEDVELTGTGEEIFPLPSGNPQFNLTTGTFNSTRTNSDGTTRRHKGQDIGVDGGSPVVSSRSGRVIDKYSSYGGHGDALIIKYDNGQQGLYGHIVPTAKVGDRVKAGEKIGTVISWKGAGYDNTHLHYMRKDTKGNDIDPLPYLKTSKSGAPIVKPKKQEDTKDPKEKSLFDKKSGDKLDQDKNKPKVTPKTPTIPTSTKSQESSQTSQSSTTPVETTKSPMPLDISTAMVPISQVSGTDQSQQVIKPEEISQYTTYNQPNISGQSVIIPIMIGDNTDQQVASSKSSPSIPSQDTQSSPTIRGASESDLLNSFVKVAFLTNLSSA